MTFRRTHSRHVVSGRKAQTTVLGPACCLRRRWASSGVAWLLRNFAGTHLTLPTVKDMHAMVILAGPGIGHRWPDRPVDLIDLAPTGQDTASWDDRHP